MDIFESEYTPGGGIHSPTTPLDYQYHNLDTDESFLNTDWLSKRHELEELMFSLESDLSHRLELLQETSQNIRFSQQERDLYRNKLSTIQQFLDASNTSGTEISALIKDIISEPIPLFDQ